METRIQAVILWYCNLRHCFRCVMEFVLSLSLSGHNNSVSLSPFLCRKYFNEVYYDIISLYFGDFLNHLWNTISHVGSFTYICFNLTYIFIFVIIYPISCTNIDIASFSLT